MSVMEALRIAQNAASHDQPKVLGGAIAALAVSYTGMMDALRAAALIVYVVYMLVKIAQRLRHKDTDFFRRKGE